MLPRYPSKSKDRKSKPLYKIVDNTIVRIPNEFIRITLLPIEDEQDIVWKNDWILSKANKSLQKLLFSLWIPSIYLDPHTVKQNEELLMMYNGGRTSDIIIPTFETEYHGVKYYFNILNCKGTGNLEMIGIMNKGRFLITDAHITRIEYMNGTPLGAVSLDDALNEEVVNENLMLENGLPHTPHALVLKIPREIQKRIDKIEPLMYSWVDGALAQVKRFFTTNIRMSDFWNLNGYHNIEFVNGESDLPKWAEPENLAKLIGRIDGRYEKFFRNVNVTADFLGEIVDNRTLDGLLTDGENLKIGENWITEIFLQELRSGSRNFLEEYAEFTYRSPRETREIIESYDEARRREIKHIRPISIPPRR